MKPIYLSVLFLGLLASCGKQAKDDAKRASLNPALAAQLWTFRGDLAKDVNGTLKKIKDLGFTYVEGFDAPFIVGNPDAFKAKLDSAGLTMFALHWNTLSDWGKHPAVIMNTPTELGAHYTGIAC